MFVYPKTFKSALEFLVRYEKLIGLFLTVLAGILIHASRSNFQAFVAQGDHGRDLYAFKRVAEAGAVPYRDFSWLFGPAMLYYYAAFFKVFGATIQTAVLGQNVLVVLTGIFIYLTASRFMPAALSFICVMWYWAFRGMEFFYTYNHSGGLLCLVIMLFALFRYIEDGRIRHVLAGFVAAFLFFLIRPSMAIAVLAAWVVSLALTEIVNQGPHFRRNFRIYFYGALLCVILALFIYWMYFRGLPVYVFWESFPITPEQRTEGAVSMGAAFKELWGILVTIFSSSLTWQAVLALLGASGIGTLFLLARPAGAGEPDRRKVILCLAALVFMTAVTFSEYLLSGIFYRLYWALPVVLLFMFFLFYYPIASSRFRIPRWILYVALFWAAVVPLWDISSGVLFFKGPLVLFEEGRNRVYTLQPVQWSDTVTRTCDYIKKNVPPGEKLFTVPFDTLYNFLTGREQPTRQWVFFKHFIIPPEQDIATIRDLEREKVNWVLISNRAISSEGGLGLFGRDYCQILGKYILTKYEVVAQFGWWTSRGSWAWDHGTVILKRKIPFKP